MTKQENGETGDSGTDRTRPESFVVVDSSTSSDFEGGSSICDYYHGGNFRWRIPPLNLEIE